MRTLLRNKQTFYYALYNGVVDRKVDGLYTGEKVVSYSDPVEMSANVSAARGSSDVELFGIDTPYSRTIVTDDMECPIKEDSVIWYGIAPTGKPNYKVTAIAKSLNSIVYAIREIDIS